MIHNNIKSERHLPLFWKNEVERPLTWKKEGEQDRCNQSAAEEPHPGLITVTAPAKKSITL